MNAGCREPKVEHRPADPAGRGLVFAWLGRSVTAAMVIAVLVGVAIWGHLTGWQVCWHRSPLTNNGAIGPTELASITIGQVATESDAIPTALRRQISMVFASAEAVDKAGIDVAPVWTAPMTDALTVSGELSFDPARVSRLSARAPGTVWKMLKTVGAKVQPGEVVLLVDATMVGKAKTELAQAFVQVRLRQKAVTNLIGAGNVVPEQLRREADAALRDAEVRQLSAEQSLANLGLPVRSSDFAQMSLQEITQQLRGLGVPPGVGFDSESGTANLLPVRATIAGVILAADVVGGEVVEAGRTLVTIVDARHLRLTVHVPQGDSRRLALGQVIKFQPDGQADEVIGQATWIGTSADEMTRTIPVRSEIPNDGQLLRASTLGRGRIVLREEANAIVVPRGAVQIFQGTPIVFVRDPGFLKADGVKQFRVRTVRTGASDGINMEILAGLKMNEIVAGKGASVLLHELTRLTQTPAGTR